MKIIHKCNILVILSTFSAYVQHEVPAVPFSDILGFLLELGSSNPITRPCEDRAAGCPVGAKAGLVSIQRTSGEA